MAPLLNKHGGLLLNDRKSVKAQRGLAFDYLRQFGKNFFTGRSVMNISMRVRDGVFDKRSQCEVLAAQMWPYGRGSGETDLLDLAAADTDPRERMRHCACYAVSRLYETVKCQRKPFNPIMGETYEASPLAPSGAPCTVAAEHVVNHPPATLLSVRARDWTLFCVAYFSVDLHFSRADLVRGGVNRLVFARGRPRVVEFELPLFVEHGIVMGARWGYYKGSLSVYGREAESATVFAPGAPPACELNGNFSHKVEVAFAPLRKGFFGGARGCVSDFSGALIESFDGGDREVEKVSGNWLKQCSFGGRVYWRLEAGRRPPAGAPPALPAQGPREAQAAPPAALPGGPEGTSILSVESGASRLSRATEGTLGSALLDDEFGPDGEGAEGAQGAEGAGGFQNVSLQSSSAQTGGGGASAVPSAALSAGPSAVPSAALAAEPQGPAEAPRPAQDGPRSEERSDSPGAPARSAAAKSAAAAEAAAPRKPGSPPALVFAGPDPGLPGALPSDCRRRGDVRALRAGDYALANEVKEGLEQRQRRDRELRGRK